jgi:CheY-like chemotaxis protein
MNGLARRRPVVLVVDDDPDFRRFVCEVVAREGLFGLEAGDGLEALEVLSRSRPGLITLDLQMPRMDGRQFLAALRGEHHAPQVHVFVITSQPQARVRAPSGCVDRVFRKPLQLDAFVAALHAVFRDELRVSAVTHAPPPATGTDFDA